MIGACIAIVVLQTAQVDPNQLERILTRNEETLGRVRTLCDDRNQGERGRREELEDH